MKVSIVGLGNLGNIYLRVIEGLEGAELASICEIDPAQTEGISCTLQSYSDLLAGDCDCVILCVPQELQVSFAKQAIDMGKMAVCQMPPALSLAEWQELEQYADSRGTRLIVATIDRYRAEINDLQAAIREGMLGSVGVVNISRFSPYPSLERQNWYREETASGGSLLQQMLSDLDLVEYVFGESTQAFGYRRQKGGVDYATVTLNLKSGGLVCIESYFGNIDEFHHKIEVAGSDGVLVYDSAQTKAFRNSNRNKDEGSFNIDTIPLSTYHNPYRLLLEDIVNDHCRCDPKAFLRSYKTLEQVKLLGGYDRD